MSTPIRIGLLGLGRHGQRYARHLTAGDVPGATLSAVWTRDPDKRARLAEALSARAVEHLEALPATVDAVIAAVPAGLHVAVADACAAAGRGLLLEKPLARTVEEGEHICAAFEAAGAPLMVAQTLRFDPLLRALRARRGELGTLTGFSFEQRIEPRGLAWEDEPELSGGGVVLQTAIHTLDAARFVTDAADAEVLEASLDRVRYTHNEDLGLVVVGLRGVPNARGRLVGDVRASKIGGSRHMRYALYGTEGGLEADFIDRTLTHTVGRERTVEAVPEAPTVPIVTQAFLQTLANPEDNPVPGRDALASLALVEAAYAAAHVRAH